MKNFKCTIPPIPKDELMHKQTNLQHCTVDQLKKLRKPPKLNFLNIIYFLIFGIPRAIIVLIYSLPAGAIFLIACTIWSSLGSPESFRIKLKHLWSALARVFLFLLGIYRINFHGQPDSDCRFILSNHACFFDGWLFLPLLPRPLDKKELLSLPCFKEMWHVFDGITVDRTKSCGMTHVLIERASDSSNPMIQMFPEGATTNGEYMLRFHLGAFLSDLPLQPVAIRYTLWGIPNNVANISFFHNYPKQWIAFLGIPAITVDITFLETHSMKQHMDITPRQFADQFSLYIANFLGVPVLDMTSSAIYKQNQKIKAE
ncbi:Acyltransferase family protein [Histomonas meleagridis]|uniref:Acyltransferase family protein n=1 Tax=Histomonas meleagridis TaxID=135588 RepID=UPI003559F694|nr:Acyltransferase family protein [Histomonas meleagridis]KAH0804189.1 Acyltransferase family protein [Histomonas meleagridis]